MKQLDPEIEHIVRAFNRVAGVSTRFSCQGLRRGLSVEAWEYGPIWFPGRHEPLACVDFAALPDSFGPQLDEYVRATAVGGMEHSRIQSSLPETNEVFVQRLEAFLVDLQTKSASGA